MASALRNVVVVGGSYVGLNTCRELMSILPQTHRILLVESHSHFNHIFTFPRFAILSGHEHKAFIPYTGFFPSNSHHKVITARAEQVHPNHIQLNNKSFEESNNVSYDYLILATGTRLAAPSMMPYDDAAEAIPYLQRYQNQLRRSEKIVIVGGGAVGVQMALDLAEIYPDGIRKEITVVHSRDRLMQVFHPRLHAIISEAFEEKGIRLNTETRAKVPAGGFLNDGSRMSIELLNGQQVEGDFVILATGQKPNNQLVEGLAAGLVNTTNGFLHVRPSLQLKDEAYSNIFAVGDIADTGLHKAARPGAAQAKVVAQNILSLIESQTPEAKFEKSPRGIHLSLGLKRNIVFRNPNEDEGQTEPTVIERDDGRADMGVEGMWERLNVQHEKPWETEVRAEL